MQVEKVFFPNLYISNSYCICIQHFIDFTVILFNGPTTFSRLNAKECYYQLIIFFIIAGSIVADNHVHVQI